MEEGEGRREREREECTKGRGVAQGERRVKKKGRRREEEGGRESEKEREGRMTDGPKEKRVAGFSTAAELSI